MRVSYLLLATWCSQPLNKSAQAKYKFGLHTMLNENVSKQEESASAFLREDLNVQYAK